MVCQNRSRIFPRLRFDFSTIGKMTILDSFSNMGSVSTHILIVSNGNGNGAPFFNFFHPSQRVVFYKITAFFDNIQKAILDGELGVERQWITNRPYLGWLFETVRRKTDRTGFTELKRFYTKRTAFLFAARFGGLTKLTRWVGLYVKYVLPMRYLSIPLAAWRPSQMAQTTSEAPRLVSPAANTPDFEVM